MDFQILLKECPSFWLLEEPCPVTHPAFENYLVLIMLVQFFSIVSLVFSFLGLQLYLPLIIHLISSFRNSLSLFFVSFLILPVHVGLHWD